MFDTLASEIAGKVVYLIFTIPITLVLGMILDPEINVTLEGLCFFRYSAWISLGFAFHLGLLDCDPGFLVNQG